MRFSELLQNHLAILERLEPHGHRLSFDRGLRRQAEHQARGVFARPGREALEAREVLVEVAEGVVVHGFVDAA